MLRTMPPVRPPRPARPQGRPVLSTILLLLIAVAVLPFVLYAIDFGWRGLTRDLSGETYLWTPGGPANLAIFGHMLAGGLLTFLAPLQVIPAVRHRRPGLHRAMGYAIFGTAVLAALGGLAFIFLRGTIGGWLMDLAFGLYGALVLLCAVQAVRYARAGRTRIHRRWALRLLVLALASWLYRLHYWVWYATTGGIASAADFTGLFDRITLFAFYLPYLLVLEWILRRKPQPS